MKYLIFLISLTLFLNADDLSGIYQKAQELESQGKYKEAMLLYKSIAKTTSKKFSIQESVDEENKKAVSAITQKIDTIEDEQTVKTIEQIVASSFNLYPYHENYYLPISYDTTKRSGRDQIEAKFQLSVKKPISYDFFGFDESINFGYTQTSWWQIYKDSAPFRETNYRPEVFVTIPYGEQNKTSLKAYAFGFLHESNGQGKPLSRSWNRLYLKGYFQFSNLFVAPRLWYRLPESDDDNPDLEDHLGYGDITLLYPYKTHTYKLMLRNNFITPPIKYHKN